MAGFNLGIDLTGGFNALVEAFSKIAPGIAQLRQSEDADIRRRGDLMGLYLVEAAFYPLYNGVADLTGNPKVPVPGPLPAELPKAEAPPK